MTREEFDAAARALPGAALDAAEVADWLATSHALVAAKLTRKARAEIGLA
ncbi:hypothetical protein OUA97_17930 [Phenylobacterium sp. 58.2.17]|nr:hypothetical protein [Phenylobacterium sp. 58.2.17]MCX7588278.1 hypothetical protein [Phenylobacterium sp. 58.2.17]